MGKHQVRGAVHVCYSYFYCSGMILWLDSCILSFSRGNS